MNPFLRASGTTLKSFFLGLVSGLLFTSLLPRIGDAYFTFQLRQAELLKPVYGPIVGNVRLAFMIFLRNYLIALLIAILPLILVCHTLNYRLSHPFKSADPLTKLRKEINCVLTVYPVAVLFAYGFFVFGVFLAHVFTAGSIGGLLQWILYLIPHGILETFGMILAASSSMAIRDHWLQSPEESPSGFWRVVPKRSYVSYLLFLLIIFLSSAFLETYVSKVFAQLTYRMMRP
jgi:uncharacterized membrane protein SpoIIM required for sporulation